MKKEHILLVFTLSLLSLGVLFAYQRIKFFDGKLHVVFCDVGQGDGIYIRTPKGVDMLIDGGPDESVLSCLSNHMPFWDKTIEITFVSHPHLDHFNGFINVLERYDLEYLFTENISNETSSYRYFIRQLTDKRVKQRFVASSFALSTKDGVRIHVLGPTEAFLRQTSPHRKIGEQKEFASLVLRISYDSFDVLTTGDSQVAGLIDAGVEKLRGIDVFQVPHHGSKSGITRELISGLLPKVAVISVGKNSYGHPSKEALEILRYSDIKILRTDESGTVEFVSDGKGVTIKKPLRLPQ